MAIRVWAPCVLALSILSVAAFAQTTGTQTVTLTMKSDSGDFIGQGLTWNITQNDGAWTADLQGGASTSTIDTVEFNFQASSTGGGAPGVGTNWDLVFSTAMLNEALAAGTYTNAMRWPFEDPGHPGLSITGNGRGCNTDTGTFTITSLTIDCKQNDAGTLNPHVAEFSATFEQHCEGGATALRGTLTYADTSGVDCGGGTTPGGSPAPAPPPPPKNVTVVLPSSVRQQPLYLPNGAETTVLISTATLPTFNGDVALAATSNAGPNDAFTVSISPQTIPAPGIGDAVVTIHTEAMTFPRVYQVTVTASTPDGTQSSAVFPVGILCDPPRILGINQPHSSRLNRGETASLKVAVEGTGPFVYQWYQGIPGVTTAPLASGTTDTMTVTGLKDPTMYWVRVSNACGTVDSLPATITLQQ